jgi:hypothetical protein
MGVGEATVRRADRVKREDPEQFEKIRKGETTITGAHENLRKAKGVRTPDAIREKTFIGGTLRAGCLK